MGGDRGALGIVLLAANASGNGWTWRYEPTLLALTDAKAMAAGVEEPKTNCLMNYAVLPAEIAPQCYLPPRDSTLPNLLLLGDSTANALYGGLGSALRGQANVLTWTWASCPPLLDFVDERVPNCGPAMQLFFDQVIANNHYDLVLISADEHIEEMAAHFPATAARLESLGVRFVLLGQTLSYLDAPARLVLKAHRIADLPPLMMAALATPCKDELGRDSLVSQSRFFSLRLALCTGEQPVFEVDGALLQRDYLHLSGKGSLFIASKLVP